MCRPATIEALATYWKPYGMGKVLVMGIYGDVMFYKGRNDPMFLNWLKSILNQYVVN